jgi:predicted nucleic acid-binding protein
MGPRYLLDTYTCIYIRQKKPEPVLARFRKLEAGEAALSVVTYGECSTVQPKAAPQRTHWQSFGN